ncbi:MAG TPA: DUF3306 domain-containing protein, partial [Telluria sp.]|nr:DUF3306 domain-containing protein [Telluria sp.]
AEPEAPALPLVEPAPAPARAVGDTPLPTLDDAAGLTAESDYSAFVGRGVDSSVRRLAMKKLFADPHFNVVDGLDIYMGDYNLPSPVSEAMLASLTHARSALGRVDEIVDAVGAAVATDPATIEAPATAPPAPPSPDQEAA